MRIASIPQEALIAANDDVVPATEAACLGLQLAKLDAVLRRTYGLETTAGSLVVIAVAPDSWAVRKGLAAGDVIRRAGFEELAQPADLARAAAAAEQRGQGLLVLLVARGAEERFVALPLRED